MPARTIDDELRELHDLYTWEVNAALGRGETSRVDRLVDEYEDRALRLITTLQAC